MIRRVLATASAVFVLVAAPVAAQAATDYPAPAPELTCSAAQVQVADTFTCTVTGEEGAEAVLQATFANGDVTIAGTTSSAPKTITGGEANFNLTAPGVEGTIDIAATVNGVTVEAQASVVVVAGLSDTGGLSNTGFDGMPLAIGAVALLVVGGAVVFVSSRRRSDEKVDQTV